MLAVIAAVLFGAGLIIQGSGAHTNAWLSPVSLLLAGLACLALHLCGINWTRK
jgi:hypothetical protein